MAYLGDKKISLGAVVTEPVECLEKDNFYTKAETDATVADVLKQAKDYTDNEIATFDFIKIVDTLPTTGLPNRIYFVSKANGENNDLFDEYLWVNDAWEYQGTKKVEVDLTAYQTKEDASLITTAKKIAEAINEVKNDITYQYTHKVDAWGYDGYLGTLLVHNNVKLTGVNMASTYAPFTLVYRDVNGCTQVASPLTEHDATNKGYVDGIAKRYNHSIRIAVALADGEIGYLSAEVVDNYATAHNKTSYAQKYNGIYKQCIIGVDTDNGYCLYAGDFTIKQNASGFYVVECRVVGGSANGVVMNITGEQTIATNSGDMSDTVVEV